MHQAKLEKTMGLIQDGKEESVQWNELLIAFSQLSEERMIHALKLLTPSQLKSIGDATEKSIGLSRDRQFEALKIRMINDGVDVSDFIQYLTDNPNLSSRKSRGRLTDAEKELRDEVILTHLSEGNTKSKAIHDAIVNKGLDLSYSSVAARVKVLQDEMSA